MNIITAILALVGLIALIIWLICLYLKPKKYINILAGPGSSVNPPSTYVSTRATYPKSYVYKGKKVLTKDRCVGIVSNNYLYCRGIEQNSFVFFKEVDYLMPEDYVGEFIIINPDSGIESKLDMHYDRDLSFNGKLVRRCVGFFNRETDKDIDAFIKKCAEKLRAGWYHSDEARRAIEQALELYPYDEEFIFTLRTRSDSYYGGGCSDVFDVYPRTAMTCGIVEYVYKF